MASGNGAMVMETGAGWTRGLRNMLNGEMSAWFGTNKWWRQTIVWAAVINLIYIATAVSAQSGGDESITIFNIFLGLAGTIGGTIMMQLAVIGEKRAGTAAWVLSKPLSRPAFILSKLLANAAGLGLTMVLAQGFLAYLVTGFVVGVWLPPLGFLAGLVALFINILFHLTLTLMLGVLLEQPGPVIGIPLAVLFAQNLLGPKLAELSPALAQALPWNLFAPLGGSGATQGVAAALMTGHPTPLIAVYAALLTSALFVAIAIYVFRSQEL